MSPEAAAATAALDAFQVREIADDQVEDLDEGALAEVEAELAALEAEEGSAAAGAA